MRKAASLALVAVLFVAGECLAADVNVKPGHPKVMLTKADIARAAKNIERDTAYSKSIKSQIDSGSAPIPAYGLVYLATRDEKVGKKGVEILMSDKTATAISKNNYEDAALGYDWLFPLLSDDQKKALFEKVKAGAAKDLAAKMDSPWTNFVQRASMRIAIAGCAFASEFPEANAWADLAYKEWREFHLPAIKINEEGGGWPEGALYGYIVYSSLTRLADTFQTSTDKNPYEDTRWFADRITWWRFHTWPMPKSFYGRAFYMYDPYGDSERWRAPMQNQEIAAELLSMRYLDGKGAADYFPSGAPAEWRWFMKALGGPIASPSDWAMLAYYDETAPVKEPEALSWYAKATGQIFIRSSWRPDATWIVYQCGPRFTYHQHLDQGQFNIFKVGDLTGESGVYEPSGPSEQEGHLQGYASRAIAHNTINIYNPAEVFSGYRSGHSPRDDGGERTWRPFSNTATSAAYWKDGFDKGAYDTGRVTEFKDDGKVVYIASDLTGAYNCDKYVSEPNKSKVHEVTRQLVYFRPQKPGYFRSQEPGDLDCLVVFDRVRATDPAFEKRLLFHFPNDVRVAGTETKAAEGEFTYDGDFAQTDTGGGRLFIRSLYPKGVKINKVGGPGKEYWVYGKNFPVPDTPYEHGYGQWRIEIMPSKQQADDCFLTVFFPADKSASAAPVVERLSGKNTLGAEVIVDNKVKCVAIFTSAGEMGAMITPPSAIREVYPISSPWRFGNWQGIDEGVAADGRTGGTFPCPAISDVKVSDVTSEVTVTWKTSAPAVGYVEYGPTAEMAYIMTPSDKAAAEHSATLRGLAPSAPFYIRVAGTNDQGLVGFGEVLKVNTPADTTPPKIFDLKVERCNPTDATIVWSTDDLASASVECVAPDGSAVTATAAAPAADQRLLVGGLALGVAYHARVTATNAAGLSSKSEQLAFTTPKPMPGYFETDFEDGKVGPFESTDAKAWTVENNSPSNMALFLNNADKKKNVTVYTGNDYGDFTLECKARTLEGDGNQFRDYAIVFGYQDAENYYAAWFCGAVDDSIPGIVRIKDGKWELVGARPNLVTLADRNWHDVKVLRKGSHIEAYFDGVKAFEADDSAFGKGKVGFGSNNDSAAFDDLKVLPEAEPPLAPSEVRTKRLSIEGLVIE